MTALALYAATVVGALAFTAPPMWAQQTPAPSGTPSAPAQGRPSKPGTPAARALTAADSAACMRIVAYVFQHQELIQEAQRLQAQERAAEIAALPDTVRASLAAALAKGKDQQERVKTLLTRAMGAEKAKQFEGVVALALALPDTVRGAVATLLGNGQSMTCGA